jgi:hypothetical protein
MLAQDAVTGQLYEVPDSQPYGNGIGFAEAPMMYDGLGNPVGFAFLAPLVSALAPLAAKALPAVAKYIAPLAQRVLPAFTRAAGGIAPLAQRVLPAITQAAGGIAPQAAQAAWPWRPPVAQAAAAPVWPVQYTPYRPAQYMPAPMSPSIEEEYGQYGEFPLPGPMEALQPAQTWPQAPSIPGLTQVPSPAPLPLPPQLIPGQFPFPLRPRPYCRAPQPVGWITPALPFTGKRPRRLYLRCSVWPGPKGLVPEIATQPVAPTAAPGMAPVFVRRHRRRGRR